MTKILIILPYSPPKELEIIETSSPSSTSNDQDSLSFLKRQEKKLHDMKRHKKKRKKGSKGKSPIPHSSSQPPNRDALKYLTSTLMKCEEKVQVMDKSMQYMIKKIKNLEQKKAKRRQAEM